MSSGSRFDSLTSNNGRSIDIRAVVGGSLTMLLIEFFVGLGNLVEEVINAFWIAPIEPYRAAIEHLWNVPFQLIGSAINGSFSALQAFIESFGVLGLPLAVVAVLVLAYTFIVVIRRG